jgi:hypothetical protein
MKFTFRRALSFFLFAASCLGAIGVRAQSVTFESVKIAETLVAANWAQLEPIFQVVFSTLETNIKSAGATENASKVFVSEMQKAINKEGVAKEYAKLIAAKFSAEEQRELFVFLNSGTGQKFLALSRQSSTDEFMAPMVKQACAGANSQLGFFDRGSLNRLCQGQ